MDEAILNPQNRQHNRFPKPFIVIYVFILTATVKFSASQPTENNCVLNFLNFTSSYSSRSCQWGEWGGFLSNNCGGAAFDGYLYALGRRANQTGKIFLNSTEQRNCLTYDKNAEGSVLACGIEKLTRGVGGCSDFSVDDAKHRLGDKLGNLEENSKFLSTDKDYQSCSSCVRSWR